MERACRPDSRLTFHAPQSVSDAGTSFPPPDFAGFYYSITLIADLNNLLPGLAKLAAGRRQCRPEIPDQEGKGYPEPRDEQIGDAT